MKRQSITLAAAAVAALAVGVQPALADPCDADVTGDGAIDVLDLIEVLTGGRAQVAPRTSTRMTWSTCWTCSRS